MPDALLYAMIHKVLRRMTTSDVCSWNRAYRNVEAVQRRPTDADSVLQVSAVEG